MICQPAASRLTANTSANHPLIILTTHKVITASMLPLTVISTTGPPRLMRGPALPWPHMSTPPGSWNLLPQSFLPTVLSARGRAPTSARLRPPHRGLHANPSLTRGSRELAWAPRPAGHGRGRGPLRLNKTKASHHSAEAQSFTLAHAAPPPTPPPPAPSPSASVLPPLPLASASPARAAHLGRRRGVAERRLAPAAAFEEEGSKQASKEAALPAGREALDRSFRIRIRTRADDRRR